MNPGPIHRLPRIAKGMAFFFILRVCVGLSFLALAAYGVYQMDLHILAGSGGLFALQVLLMGIQMAENSGCRCAVCTTPLFHASRGREGSLNDRAKSVEGSYRLYRSLEIIFASYYHCNHCGEKVKFSLPETTPPPKQYFYSAKIVQLPKASGRRAS